jgi:Leu/Phe-tRNA-protein transferase
MSSEWINKENLEIAKKLAEEHWTWLESLLRKIYVDAFIHGFHHGLEESEEE